MQQLFITVSFLLVSFISTANAKGWNGQKLMEEVGYTHLPCVQPNRPTAGCCMCRSIVEHLERSLEPEDGNDKYIAVGHRISEEKGQILESRTVSNIMDTMDTLCEGLPVAIPWNDTRQELIQSVFAKACLSFVDEFEDNLIKAFYGEKQQNMIDLVCTEITEECVDGVPKPYSPPPQEDEAAEEISIDDADSNNKEKETPTETEEEAEESEPSDKEEL